jgi:hypothetical protein
MEQCLYAYWSARVALVAKHIHAYVVYVRTHECMPTHLSPVRDGVGRAGVLVGQAGPGGKVRAVAVGVERGGPLCATRGAVSLRHGWMGSVGAGQMCDSTCVPDVNTREHAHVCIHAHKGAHTQTLVHTHLGVEGAEDGGQQRLEVTYVLHHTHNTHVDYTTTRTPCNKLHRK